MRWSTATMLAASVLMLMLMVLGTGWMDRYDMLATSIIGLVTASVGGAWLAEDRGRR